jgi:hypothetical protein
MDVDSATQLPTLDNFLLNNFNSLDEPRKLAPNPADL